MDKNFLEELLKKQKIWNLRNIHLNCNPWRQINRLDIHLIDEFIPSFSNIFLKRLLKNDIFKIDIDLNKYKREFNDEKDEDEYYERKNNVYRKLEKIYQEYNDLYDEYWYKTFSFWYPIVCKKFISNWKEKLLQAPLFLWNLDISKNFSWKYCFNIKRDEDNEVLINWYLLSFLLYEENIKIDHENDFEQNYDFKNLMDSFKEKLWIHDNFKIWSLEKFKTKEQLDLQIQGFEILPYGLFWNFKSQKQSIIKDLNNCLDFVDEVNEDAENILWDMHSFSKIETDPSQFSIIEKLWNSKDIIIQWPPWTGKSQTITAILVNALDNGKKCLVVCDKRTALEIIRKNLWKDWLDKLSVLIDDVNKDRNYIVDQVRWKYSELGNKIQYLNTNFDENLYLKNIANFKENLDKYKKNFNNLRKNRLDKKNFKSLVWEYLKYKNLWINLDKEIHNYIQENSIDNTDIYNLYNGIINNIGKLYSDKFERSLLNNLGDNFFSKDLFDLRDELNEDLADLKKIIESLIKSKIDLKDIINSIWNQIRHLIKNVDLIVENILNNISEINSKSIEIYWKEIFDKKIYNPIQNLSKNNNALKEIYKEESSLYSGEHADEIFKYIENIFNQWVEIKNFYKSSAEAFWNDLNKIYKKQNELICLLTQSKKYWDEVYSFKGFPNFKIKFLSIFSKKYKDIFLRNEDITSKITELDILIKYYNIKFNIYKNFEKKKELENLSLILNDLGNNILKFNSFEWFKFSNIHSEKFEKDISSYKEFKINLNKYYKFLLDKVESFSIKLDKNFIENFNEDIIESERKNLEKLNKNLRKEISELDKIYEWKKYYLAQNGKDKNFIDMLIKNYKTSDISNIFRYHFIENILRNIYNEIPWDNDFIENFEKISDSLSNDQKKSIENRRNNMFIESVEEKEFLKKGFLQSLYNKRWNTWWRRNSLRKIIKTDFSIFSNAFPIVLANPSVCSSLFPLTKWLFDVVLFDEASQIRIEDSYCSLIRWKKHIICWDNKQMPPSSFFDRDRKSVV